MGIMAIFAPRHNVAAGMRDGISKLADEVGGQLADFQARSRATHIGNGTISVGASAIPLDDPAVRGVMKLINSKQFDKALAPRRLRESVTPSSVHDARAAVQQARQDLAISKEQRKSASTLTVSALDMQDVLGRVNNALKDAHFTLSSKAVEKEIRAAAPVRKLRTAATVAVIGGGAATAGYLTIPGAKDTVDAKVADIYKQYAK